MADTTALKNKIRAAIKANGNQEITGPVLQQALLDMVDELNGATETEASQRQNGDSTLQQSITAEKNRAEGVEQSLSQADTTLNNLITGIKNNIDNGYVYAGIAMPSTTPVSGKVFYVAVQAGTYTNFGGAAVTEGITILKYNGASWVKEQALFTDGGVFDISDYHATGGTLATYDNLEDALGANGKNIPQSLRKGGMSVKFVQSSDNKYVQYRLMKNQWSTTVDDWVNVDNEISISSGSIRGLDFSNYSGNITPYIKGIIFAGFVPVSGYAPSISEIYAFSKNKENDGKLNFWLWFGDGNHAIRPAFSLSDLHDGVNCLTSSDSHLGTLYLIIDISKYADGEVVIFGGTQGARVQVELLDANDTRICNWQNTYVNHLNLTDAADSQTSPKSIDLTLKSGNNTITHLVLPSATNEKAGLLSAKEKKYVDSEEAVRGLDFSNYTGDKSLYSKGIIFIGVVLADGYTPNEKPKIFALSKNKEGDNLFCLWLITEIGGSEHKITGTFNLSTLSKSNDGIAHLKATGALGTMYAVVNTDAYTDGEVVIWGVKGPFVEVNTIMANDPRICNWANEYVNQRFEYVNQRFFELNEVKNVTTDSINVKVNATEIFKGVYATNGNLITSYERYSALYPVVPGKTYLYTNIDYPHVGVAGYDLVFLDSSRNFLGGIPANTQETYNKYPITIDYENQSVAYIAAIAGYSSTLNASGLTATSLISKASFLQEQFRLLDFSSFTGDKQPYYESVIFAAVVWKNKPEWAVKPEIYVLSYNYDDSDNVTIAIEYGNNGTSNQSLWVSLYDVSQLDSVPKYYFKKVSQGNLFDFYVIFSPKAIVDYYNTYHKSIVYGGAYGTHVCTEELTSDDPRLAMFNVASQISAINTRIDNIVVHSAFWNNKKMVWYGTSIPAGSDPTLGQEGIGITYPQITASYLGATCNNEAVGSGRAAYLAPVQNETYQHLMRCQGGTIASKLSLFNDIYVIDDDNETVTLGPNTYGVRDLPVSGTPTYAQAVSLRLEAIKFSYEIKLISRYLDSTNQYLQEVLNSQEVAASIHYSGTGYELLHRTDMDYKFTPDLFVFDHGTNDYGHMSNNDDVTTRDTTKFYGAMNMMYDLIQFYAPKSLVCIVTDYGTSRYNSDLVINEQQTWANYWQIPCLRTCDIVPWNGTVITVQGYWDGTTAQGGQWHDDGFYFTVNGDAWETNNGIILRAYNSSTPASTIISRYNIRTIRGKQVYDIQQKYKFFKDGLHPHTDTSGNALKLYARYLSRLIETYVAPNRD